MKISFTISIWQLKYLLSFYVKNFWHKIWKNLFPNKIWLIMGEHR